MTEPQDPSDISAPLPDVLAAERRACLRFGWAWLTLWASLGMALEAAHGLKWGPYLHDELGRLLLTLGHAHGVGLAIVVLVYGSAGAALHRTRAPGWLLRIAATLIPVGFATSAVGHPEGDPSIAIVLVPLGGMMLIAALAWTAVRAWGANSTPSG